MDYYIARLVRMNYTETNCLSFLRDSLIPCNDVYDKMISGQDSPRKLSKNELFKIAKELEGKSHPIVILYILFERNNESREIRIKDVEFILKTLFSKKRSIRNCAEYFASKDKKVKKAFHKLKKTSPEFHHTIWPKFSEEIEPLIYE